VPALLSSPTMEDFKSRVSDQEYALLTHESKDYQLFTLGCSDAALYVTKNPEEEIQTQMAYKSDI